MSESLAPYIVLVAVGVFVLFIIPLTILGWGASGLSHSAYQQPAADSGPNYSTLAFLAVFVGGLAYAGKSAWQKHRMPDTNR